MKKITLLLVLFFTTLISAQVANQPSDLVVCDDDNDGIFCFDLTFQIPQILGSQNPADYSVTFHGSQSDADSDSFPLPTTYCSMSAETIFVRVEDISSGGVLFDTTSFQLIVNLSPTIFDPTNLDLFLCDEPTSNDGFTTFDLTVNEAQILGTQSPSEFTLGYYETSADAANSVNQISNPSSYANVNAYNQTIYIRLSNTNNGCFVVGTFNILVNVPPVLIQLQGLEACDAVSLNDGIEVFDLTSLAGDLLNNASGISLEYYANASDLSSDTPIANPAMYSNTVIGVQTIFVRATNDTTGCENTITFDIRVNPLPSPTLDPSGMLIAELCDDDNDGFQSFDLNALATNIINNEPEVIYSFHETLSDAQQNLFPLTSPYTNIITNIQQIYVLATNTITGCFTISTLQLTVNPIPVLTSSSFSYTFCEYDNDNVGQFNWNDVTTSLNLLQAPQNINDFVVTYHATVADAMNNTAALANGYENTTDPQTVFIRVEDITTGCYNENNIASLQLTVENRPQATTIFSAYELCALDASDQNTAIFNLTSLDATIINGQNNVGVSYYESSTDAINGVNSIVSSNSYINTSNPQTLYATTQNIFTGCFSDPVTVNLQVNPLPVVTLPEDTIRCVDGTGVLLNPFEIGTDLGPGYSYQWSTGATTPTVIVSVPGTYSVSITDNNSSTSCSSADSINIFAESLPCALSVEEVNAINIELYPNPVKEELKLQADANMQIERLEVYSLTGKKVLAQRVSSNDSIAIDVRRLPSGFYILKVQTAAKGVLTKRFIIE